MKRTNNYLLAATIALTLATLAYLLSTGEIVELGQHLVTAADMTGMGA